MQIQTKGKDLMRIALTGNPNSGKTTMFNALTGGNEKVGNWAGVTVEKKVHHIKKNFCNGKKDIVAHHPVPGGNKEITNEKTGQKVKQKTDAAEDHGITLSWNDCNQKSTKNYIMKYGVKQEF